MRKTTVALVLLTLMMLLSGCNTNKQNKNIFDKQNITIEFLKEKDCLFYENLIFASDNKNHVFVVSEDKISEHYIYNKVEFSEERFDSVRNKNIVDAVEYIGIPSYIGVSSELSLDYSYNDGYIRRLKMSKNNDEILIKEIEVLDKENPTTWFDEEKSNLPTLSQCQEISVGMSIDEVVRKIGKPQRDVGSGARLFQFNIDDGSKLTIRFELDVDKENEYVHNNPNVSVYGSHCLYVASIKFDNK